MCLFVFHFINKFVSITGIIKKYQRGKSILQTGCAVNMAHYMTHIVNKILSLEQSSIAYVGLAEQETCKMGNIS